MKKPKGGKPVAQAETVEQPPRIRPTHVRDRTLSAVAGSPKGFRNVDWPIQIAKENGRLSSAHDRHDHNGEQRWLAIEEYRTQYETLHRSGRDSTDIDGVASRMNTTMTEEMEWASRWMVAVDSHMSQKDRIIIRKLVEGWSLPGAVRTACGDDYRHVVIVRVRDALDVLIDAITICKRDGFRHVRMGGA